MKLSGQCRRLSSLRKPSSFPQGLRIPRQRSSSKSEVRAAYLELIRRYHPDVSLDEDATEKAVELNEAYKVLLQGVQGSGCNDKGDIFDLSEGDADLIFVNPFSCSINPLDWEKLQEVAQQGEDPQAAIARQGVFVPESAVHYVTDAQLTGLREILEDMDLSLDYLTSSWMLSDQLSRARIANYRWQTRA